MSQYKQFIPNIALRWRHNDHAGVSNHQPHGCLINRLFRRQSKKTSKLRVTGLCVGNSPGTGEFPAQMASYAENVSIWWRHHGISYFLTATTVNMAVKKFISNDFNFAHIKTHLLSITTSHISPYMGISQQLMASSHLVYDWPNANKV